MIVRILRHVHHAVLNRNEPFSDAHFGFISARLKSSANTCFPSIARPATLSGMCLLHRKSHDKTDQQETNSLFHD